jgi:hypothetical protein
MCFSILHPPPPPVPPPLAVDALPPQAPPPPPPAPIHIKVSAIVLAFFVKLLLPAVIYGVTIHLAPVTSAEYPDKPLYPDIPEYPEVDE